MTSEPTANEDSLKPTTSVDACGLPFQGRLAGIDFGTVRIGISVCDPTQNWVSPLGTYQSQNPKKDGEYFCQMAKKEALCGWVLGLPIHCDGNESQKSKEVRAFAAWLEQATDLPLAFFDERFTTAEARRLLIDTGLKSAEKKKQLDRIAAYLILTGYLQSDRSGKSQNEPLGR